jgi:hypothetical protein
MKSTSDDGDLRVGEHNTDGCAAQTRNHWLAQRETCGLRQPPRGGEE